MLEAAAREDGGTFIARQSYSAPFHVGKPYWDGRVLQVQIVNPTAGILSQDQMRVDLSVAPRAALSVTTPSAARAFMMRTGGAVCHQQFTVMGDGWLEYAPEALYPHAGTDFTQRTTIDLNGDAGLFYVDSLAPGRVARGELWAWRRLVMELEVRENGRTTLRERLDSTGAELGEIAAFHGMPTAWFATAIVHSPKVREMTDDFIAELGASHDEGLRIAATRTSPRTLVIRLIAREGAPLRSAIDALRKRLSEKLPALTTNHRKL
jgi:urease accessory protein